MKRSSGFNRFANVPGCSIWNRSATSGWFRELHSLAASRGITMIEVLMSLMIMSIGISAVAVLFPISVLRSVQATQLTNAAILKYNAEALFQTRPAFVFDPDGDTNFQEHFRNATEEQYIIDPAGYFAIGEVGTFSTYPTLSANNDFTKPNDSTLRGLADWFGNLDTNNDGIPEPFVGLPRYDGGIRTATIDVPMGFPNGYRPSGGDPEEARALRLLGSTLSKLGDGWDTQIDTIPVDFVLSDGSTPGGTAASTASIVGLKLPDDIDLSGISTAQNYVPRISSNQVIPDPEVCRIIIFSADGTFSVSLPLVGIDNTTKIAVWSEDINFNSTGEAGEDVNLNGTLDVRSLPLQFVNSVSNNFAVGKVLLQSSRTHDYNWLLTVRRGSDGSARGVDVVITHNKGITPDEERLFSTSFNTSTLAGNSPYVISVLASSGKKADLEDAEPLLRKSGYVLDVQNARWYRIRDYREETVTVGVTTGPGFRVTLETPVLQNSLSGAAMFLPGVIDVYPMGSIPIPPNI